MGKTALRNLVFGLVGAGILASMCAMALSSRLNVHPHELDHVKAGRYFIEYWDIPAMRLNFSNADPEHIAVGISRMAKGIKALLATCRS